MEKIIYKNTMEYLSLILVLTFLLLHNIYLVFIGVFLAVYTINKKYINDIISKLPIGIFNYGEIKIESSIESNSDKIDLIEEDFNISLVEKVEESGIIPSLSKDNENIAA